MKRSIRLTKWEHAFVVALVINPEPRPGDHSAYEFSDEQRALIASKLGQFMGQLTRKLLRPPSWAEHYHPNGEFAICDRAWKTIIDY